MIILNEKEYALKCLEKGDIGDNPYFTLSILAKYYYHSLGYRRKKIAKLLLEFISKHYPRYEMNEMSWQTSIDKIASNAGSYELFEISGIKITKNEMAVISEIHNKVLERLMFTMLCLAKLGNSRNPKNNGWVNADSKEIFKCARITCKSNEREIKIGQLWQRGLLEFSKRNDNLNCRVTFIDDNEEEELFVSDFRELGYEYLLYTGNNFIRCAECGILTRGNKNGTKRYCKECSVYTPQKTKLITCADCGKEFEVDARVSNKVRCKQCQEIKIREDTRARVQKLRCKIT